MKILGPNTLISLSFAASTVGVAAMWITAVEKDAIHLKQEVDHVKEDQKNFNDFVKEVIDRLARIEGELKKPRR